MVLKYRSGRHEIKHLNNLLRKNNVKMKKQENPQDTQVPLHQRSIHSYNTTAKIEQHVLEPYASVQ